MPLNSFYKIVIIIPVLNEEKYLPKLFRSINKQIEVVHKTEIVVVDNGSSDETVQLAKDFGCTLLYCKRKSIGAARQKGVDYVLKKYEGKLQKTVIFQLDADEELIGKKCLYTLINSYRNSPNTMISIGPTYYELKRSGHRKITVKTGKDFRKIFNVKTLDELFQKYKRDINDYLIPSESHKFLVGGNTAYRAIVFTLPNVEFPKDNSWETIVISIRVQQHVKSSQIKFIKEQIVRTSSRSFVDSKGLLSKRKLKSIQKKGYITPFKAKATDSPYRTAVRLIDQIDNETYGLQKREKVLKVINKSEVKKYKKTFPLLHAKTLLPVKNKFVVIR